MGIHDEREFNRALDQFTVDPDSDPFPIFRWVNPDGTVVATLMSNGTIFSGIRSIFEQPSTYDDETYPRFLARNGSALASGTLNFSVFTSRSDAVITKVRCTSVNAAAATPTLIRVGVWEWNDSADSGTLVASSANDTTKLAAANTLYTFPLSAALNKRAGTRYAVGVLVVSDAAMPHIAGYDRSFTTGLAELINSGQRIAGVRTGLADLPATLTSQGGSGPVTSPYWQMLT